MLRIFQIPLAFRNDGESMGRGGVLIAVKQCFELTEKSQAQTDCECIWLKLSMECRKSICICSYYRPQKDDLSSLLKFEKFLKKFPKNGEKWNLGDLNFPHYDWDSNTINSGCPCRTVYETFKDLISNYNLSQVVKSPTRNENILDLFLLDQPSVVHNLKTLLPLGNADHEIVHCEMKLPPPKSQQPQRKNKTL